jgi:hypothetical protein
MACFVCGELGYFGSMTADPNIMPEPDPHLEVIRPGEPPLEESEFPDESEGLGVEPDPVSDHEADDPDADQDPTE